MDCHNCADIGHTACDCCKNPSGHMECYHDIVTARALHYANSRTKRPDSS